MVVLGSMLAAQPLSGLMARYGRRTGFSVATGLGAMGAMIAAYGLYTSSFALLLLGSLFTGVYMSAQGFYRFAATDTATPEFQPKAISYVMAGGLASAIIGPQLMKLTAQAMAIPFLATYLAIILINLAGRSCLPSSISLPRRAVRKACRTKAARCARFSAVRSSSWR